MFYFHLFLVTKAIIVFEVAVEELNNALLLSPVHILEISTWQIYIFIPDQSPLFILVKARDYSRWG